MTSIRTNAHVADAAFRARRWRVAAIATAIAATAILAGCDSSELLDVETPAVVPVSLLDDPANAGLMVNSVAADFGCALGAAIGVEGLISDELADAQLGAAAWPYDRRDANVVTNGIYGTGPCTSNQNPGIYTPLSTARWSADNALQKLTTWTDAEVPSRQIQIARAALYAGLSYSLLGMSMCEAAFDLGPQVNQQAIFGLAEQRFTQAITAAQAVGASAASTLSAAYVGRARVRLFLGNKTGGATDAALVPAGFVLAVANDASDNRLYNRIFAMTSNGGLYTVETGARNLTTERGEVDPRSASTLTATKAADNRSVIWVPN